MNLFDYLLTNPAIKGIASNDNVTLNESTDEANIMILATDFYANNHSIIVVLPNLYMAQKYYDSLINFVKEEDCLFFPADELMTSTMLKATGDFKYERINTLSVLLSKQNKIVVTNLNGALRLEFSKETWLKNILTIEKGKTYDINSVSKQLIEMGYIKTYTTTKTGEFSSRGSILDIFPLNYSNPVRLDFFGDELDTLKTYDNDTQRSIDNIDQVTVIPVTEMLYNDIDYILAKKKIDDYIERYPLSEEESDRINNNLLNMSEHNDIDMLMPYINFFTNSPSTIFDFCLNSKTYIIDYAKCEEVYNHMILELEEYCNSVNSYFLVNLKYFKEISYLKNRVANYIDGIRGVSKANVSLGAMEITPYQGDMVNFYKDLKMYLGNMTVVIAVSHIERVKRIKAGLLENEIYYYTKTNDINIDSITILEGVELPSFEIKGFKLIVLNEKTIFEKTHNKRKIKYKSIFSNATKISKYDELVPGDYIVHYDHGVGKYIGMESMDSNGLTRDYIKIEYKGGALFIPIDQINSVMKYASYDTPNVKINTMGGTDWERTKQKVKGKIKDISEELIKLYAAREKSEGFKFDTDSELQSEFESGFPYDLTLDQAKAINDVKRDMESTHPMDRLIVGDVGYGKTEVAMRAAFKAVLSGKQVAMLAPTTVLARQHFYTFKDRMEDFGLRIELLSRFVSAKRQKEVIEGLKTGAVDIVIGTHRLLSNEIVFKDLGLLVIDEEQRFGVSHKERIKTMKVNVDTITLSATPIPRTLQMSIAGIKDMSMIETPPKNRYPVQTYVLSRNNAIIREAIERELARGGQVFYLYNKVDDILEIADTIHQLVPTARICVGHGQMSKDALEDTLCKFIDHEYDILVCTTIIETGIDMPDTNTLIIHDADYLGLSQLYQIRGRVGRSNKIAYAYLMYEPRKVLNEIAEKRLSTIKEFNELGSGFKIAMRDLAIRGSGDILGAEQSGFIDSVGIDMYMKLLNECIEETNNIGEKKIEKDVSLKIPLAKEHIAKKYIESDDVRIEMHKKIDKVSSLSELTDLQNEFIDRFGSMDNDITDYMYDKLLKKLCDKLDIYRINRDNKFQMILYMTKSASEKADGNKMFSEAIKASRSISLTYMYGEIRIIIAFKKNEDYLKLLCIYLNNILNN